MEAMQSQIGQDKFVVDVLNNKRNGTFLDLGCNHCKNISNTFYLEKELDWSGLALDISDYYKNDWENHRPKSKFICTDATKLDFQKLLDENNMPKVIDYLSLDLEPPAATFEALIEVMKTDYTFLVITFETDYYRYKDSLIPSRELLKSKGYVLVNEETMLKYAGRTDQDDFYIHNSIL
jgi:hypothetical protein